MFNLLWKILGYHVCETFTAWEDHVALAERAATQQEGLMGIKKVKYVKRWQERKCTNCGKIEQHFLHFGGLPDPTTEEESKEKG